LRKQSLARTSWSSATPTRFLACDALRQGYHASICTYNLTVFDPTWFAPGVDIAERLQRQREVKQDARLQNVTEDNLEFLKLGGCLRLTDLSRPLIRGLLHRKLPIVTGFSSTYLYRAAREYGQKPWLLCVTARRGGRTQAAAPRQHHRGSAITAPGAASA